MPPQMFLTEGAITMLATKEAQTSGIKPVLQVTHVLPFFPKSSNNNAVENERYRIVLSDGAYSEQCLLSTKLFELVRLSCIKEGSVVQLTQFFCSSVQNRRIILIVDLDVVLEWCDPIGKPIPLKMDEAALSPPINNSRPSFYPIPVNQAGASATAGAANASVSVPKPNPPVNVHMLPSEINHSLSSLPHGSSFGNNLESRQCSSLDSPPQYGRTESNPGVLHTHINQLTSPVSHNGGHTPHTNQLTSPVLHNGGHTPHNEACVRIVPIASLNPYQNRWTIKARVTAKGELRHFKKPSGDGKVFSFDLLDSDSGEIKATCFNTVADQFYNQVEVGKVYMISKGSVKPAQKNYNHLPNDYEIFLENNSVIQPCFEDDNFVPKLQFRFRSISEIQLIEKESVVDVIGVMSFVGPSDSTTRKNGTEIQKRILKLKDMSGMSIDVTLWGNVCHTEGLTLQNMYNSGVFPVIAIKSCKVNDFKGRCLGTIFSSQLLIEPDLPEACELKAWFDTHGKSTPSISISKKITNDVRRSISQIEDERIGMSEKPEWITVCATLTFIKVNNIVYTACPLMVGDRKCHKKVTSNLDGKWRCDRCFQVVDECEYRYAFQFQIQDHTGFAWVTAFQESGEAILGVTAREFYSLKYKEKDNDKVAKILRSALFMKHVFKLRVKEETFGAEQALKATASIVEKAKFASETKYILDLIAKSKQDYSCLPPEAEMDSLISDNINSLSGSLMLRTANAAMNYGLNSCSVIKEHVPSTNLEGSYRNQHNVSTPDSSPPTIMYMGCRGCGGTDHSSKKCPSLMNDPGQFNDGNLGGTCVVATSGGPVFSSRECFKCRQIGHWAKDCPMVRNLQPAYGNITPTKYGNSPGQQVGTCVGATSGGPVISSRECFKCHQIGHWEKDCPMLRNLQPAYGNITPTKYGNSPRHQVGSSGV